MVREPPIDVITIAGLSTYDVVGRCEVLTVDYYFNLEWKNTGS